MAKKIIFYSSAGLALFPYITMKDMDGKFSSKKYSTQLAYQSPEDLAKDKARLQAIADSMTWENTADGIHLPFKTDKRGEETLCAKSTYLPMIYDAKKAVLVDKWRKPDWTAEELKPFAIRQGAIIRIAAVVFPYDTSKLGCGLSLQMDSVQYIKAPEGGAEGFDVEDGEEYQAAAADGFGGGHDYDDDIPF